MVIAGLETVLRQIQRKWFYHYAATSVVNNIIIDNYASFILGSVILYSNV